MSSLFVILVISFTATIVVATGILLTYVLISAILYAFGRQRMVRATAGPLLIPIQTPASGD